LPVEGTHFIDLSEPPLRIASARPPGSRSVSITGTAVRSGKFDLVCAFDIVEHVDDGDGALSELVARVRAAAPC